jgi:hypothetical protein
MAGILTEMTAACQTPPKKRPAGDFFVVGIVGKTGAEPPSHEDTKFFLRVLVSPGPTNLPSRSMLDPLLSHGIKHEYEAGAEGGLCGSIVFAG